MSASHVPDLNGRFLSPRDEAPNRPPTPRLTHQATELATPRLELLLGRDNLLPFHFLRTGDRLGRAVVKLRRPDGGTGTGFLVAPDVVLTNNHVLPDIATASRSFAVANYEDPADGEPAMRVVEVPLEPGRLFVTQPDLDFTFCGVAGLEGLGTIPLARDSLALGPSEVVNIIQHPRGRPKEIAIQDNQVIRANDVVVHYLCDTEPGSSGSPVFDNRWRLAALHHASIATDDPGVGRSAPGAAPEARFLNEGVRLSAIALWLETSEAESREDPVAIARLRSLFRGLDPQAGLFGALGRSSRRQTAAEIVAAGGARGAEVLDIAYWDLGDLAPGVLGHLDGIGQILAALNMDVWCLTNVAAVALRALGDYLDTCFRLEYLDLPGPLGSTVAVLVRRSRPLEADRPSPDLLRLRVGTATDRLASFSVRLMPGQGPSVVIDRIEEIGPEGQGDWIFLGGPSAWIGSEDLRALRARGLNLLVADAGADGGVVLLRDRNCSAIARGFVSPNARSSDEDFHAVCDRYLPDEARALVGSNPIALRIVLRNN